MLSKTTMIMLAVLVALAAVAVPPAAKATASVAFDGGTGTSDDPYIITTADQLNEVRNGLNKHYALAADIDLSTSAYASGWTPIGWSNGSWLQFSGVFNGQGYTISGLRVVMDSTYVALFGHNSSTGVITDLTLAGAEITNSNGYYSAVLVGRNEGTLSQITVIDSTVTGDAFTGSVAGGNSGTIAESQVIGGAVVGFQDNGGLVGTNNGNLLRNRVWNTSVTGTSASTGTTGGLAGTNNQNGIVEWNVYLSATAVVKGAGTTVGGLVGGNYGTVRYGYAEGHVGIAGTGFRIGGLVGSSNAGIIEDSYARTTVAGKNNLGGLVGSHDSAATISRSYADAAFPSGSGGGLIGMADGTVNASFWHTGSGALAAFISGTSTSVATGLNETQLGEKSHYTSAGWNFTDVWQLNEGEGAPSLAAWLGNLTATVDGAAIPLYFNPYRYEYRLNVPSDTSLVGVTATKRTATDTVYVRDQPANVMGVVMPLDADYLAFPVVVHRDGNTTTYTVHFHRSAQEGPVEVDWSALVTAVQAASASLDAAEIGTGAGQYVAADLATFESAIAAAQAVLADAEVSQSAIDAAIAALAAAAAAFAEAAIEAVEADRSALEAAVQAASAALEAAEIGTGAGQYVAADLATFESAIAAAQAVLADTEASQSAIDAALNALISARQAFVDAAVGAVLLFAEEIVEEGQSYLLLTFNHPVSGVSASEKLALNGADSVTVAEASVVDGDSRKVKARLTGPLPASGAVKITAQAGAVTVAEDRANPASSEIIIIRHADTLALRQQLLTYGTASGGDAITIMHVASHADAFLAAMEQYGIDEKLLLRYLLRQIGPA